MRSVSSRFHFVLVVVVTLLLLVGSTILQQLVFKADQETATLALSPTTFRATQGGTVDFDITQASADTVFVTGLQAEISIDAAKFSLVEAVPRVGWRTLVLQQTPGSIFWLLAPSSAEPTISEVIDGGSFGRVRLQALTAGAASVALKQNGTILAAVDPAQGNFVYNAATGVQSSTGSITAASESELTFPETAVPTLTAPETTKEPLFGAQRIATTYAVATARDVLVFVGLAYPGRVSVEFGPTPQFGNTVESTTEEINHVLRLANLTAGKQYYYRVIGEEAGEQSRVVGVTRSITVSQASTETTVSSVETEVIAFPNKTDREASVYVFPRDESGAAVAASAIELPSPAGVTVATPKKQAGYWQFDVTGTTSDKSVVSLRPKLGDTLLASASVIFDPNYTAASKTPRVQELVLAWNQKTMMFLLGAAVLLFLLGFLFVRLVRSR